MSKVNCIECKVRKKVTGSFLCDPCQSAMIDRINKSAKERDEKMSIEAVRKLMEKNKNIKAKEISEETGLGISTVYVYMSKIRKNEEIGIKGEKENESANEWKIRYKELKVEYDKLDEITDSNLDLIEKLELKVNSLKKDNADLTEKAKGLEAENKTTMEELEAIETKYKELSEISSRENSTENKEIKSLLKINEEYQGEITELKNKLQAQFNEYVEEIKHKEKMLKQEALKHDALLKYLMILMKRDN